MSASDSRPDTGAPDADLARKMFIALDGLWFMNVLEALGPEKTLEIDIRVFIGLFKVATRTVKGRGLHASGSVAEKRAVMESIGDVFGHRYVVEDLGDRVRMRITRCTILENLRRAGRADVHDCRILCRALARPWFAELEPRTEGAGEVQLTLPVGGDRCDWVVSMPV
jgi:hypothetical protein